MKLLPVTLALCSPLAFATIDMKPGLWKVTMKVKQGGKELDPMGEMNKAMQGMSGAQKKKMPDSMNMNEKGETLVCHTEAMIQDPSKLTKNQNSQCTTKVLEQTKKIFATSFNCEDGTKGTARWEIPTTETMKGLIKVTSPKGQDSEVSYDGKFSSKDCGKIKPAI